jgi:hypothetical protein
MRHESFLERLAQSLSERLRQLASEFTTDHRNVNRIG